MAESIRIKNIYYMLTYAFQSLRDLGRELIEVEEFQNIHDLFASILIKGITIQIKRGLHRDYVQIEEKLGNLRGKIDVSNSLKQLAVIERRMICQFDLFFEDEQLNQILKTTMLLLLHHGHVKHKSKQELRKLLMYFSGVTMVNPLQINWRTVKYHRNNLPYKMLINLCWLVIKGLLQTTTDGTLKLAQYLDDQKMHQLYEKFVLNYYKKEHPELSVDAAYIEWDVDEDSEYTFLPIMKSDITLSNGEKALIIDTKYYGRTMQHNALYNSTSIISGNLYQIYAYVKNKDRDKTGQVSGVLLYAKTDEEITPDNEYRIGGNRIGVRTLDLNIEFNQICNQLDSLCEEYLSE